MSQIKDLKNSKENIVNVVDFIEMIVPDVKTKYYELFLKIFKNSVDTKHGDKIAEARSAMNTLFPEKKEEIDSYSSFNLVLMSYLFDLLHDTSVNVETLKKFIDFNERNLIEKNDLTAYKSYDEIHNQMIYAEMKVQEKELQKQVVKLVENEDWLVLKPLTYEASVKYGYNTKWCTAMEKQKSYFTKYAKEGILIYFINKNNNKKIAVYKKLFDGERSITITDITFWDETDKNIDSFTSGLPGNMLDMLREHFEKHPVTNENVLELLIKNDRKPGDLNKEIEKLVNTKTKLASSDLSGSIGIGIGEMLPQNTLRRDSEMTYTVGVDSVRPLDDPQEDDRISEDIPGTVWSPQALSDREAVNGFNGNVDVTSESTGVTVEQLRSLFNRR